MQHPLHNIIHHANTCCAKGKVRRLLLESSKEVKGPEDWIKLEKLGVITKVGPGEPVDWLTALHLAPKVDNDLWAYGDLHPLDSITRLDHHPLPSLRAFQDKLAVASRFSGRFSVV